MPRYLLKLTDKQGNDFYMEWSTVVDAPVTYGMPLEEFTQFYREEYGNSSMRGEFQDRMERVEKNGSSHRRGESAQDIIECNRAGEGETELSYEDIVRIYCHDRPMEKGNG